MVDERIELTFDDLLGMGLDEFAITLTCVSNEVGGDLLGNAKWLGIPVRDLLRLAGPRRVPTWCSRAASTASRRAPRWSRSPMTASTPSSPSA